MIPNTKKDLLEVVTQLLEKHLQDDDLPAYIRSQIGLTLQGVVALDDEPSDDEILGILIEVFSVLRLVLAEWDQDK